MAKSKERARQYYEQCREAYDELLIVPYTKMILGMNGKEIDMPSSFYDAYNVPAELLRNEVRNDAMTEGERTEFEHKLLEMMHDKTPFDFDALKKKGGTKDRRKQKQYKVYFELYYSQKTSSKPLFKQQITIGNITYQWCSKKTLNRQVKSLENQKGVGDGLYKRRCDERFSLRREDTIVDRNLRPIVAKVRAFNELEAVNIVSSKLDDYIASINALQVRGKQSATMFSSKPKTKHKTTVVSVGVFLVQADSQPVEILIENSRQALPTEQLTITDHPIAMRRLATIITAFSDDSPAAAKLRGVTRELAQAIYADNPNLRQLSYWRCLEIATARSDGETRKETDVVKIFQNYHSRTKHWHQMGEIVKDIRNKYVHRGVSESGEELHDYYLNWSQQYAEAAFSVCLYLYGHRSTWKTEADIDAFFDFYTQTDDELRLASRFLSERTRSEKS